MLKHVYADQSEHGKDRQRDFELSAEGFLQCGIWPFSKCHLKHTASAIKDKTKAEAEARAAESQADAKEAALADALRSSPSDASAPAEADSTPEDSEGDEPQDSENDDDPERYCYGDHIPDSDSEQAEDSRSTQSEGEDKKAAPSWFSNYYDEGPVHLNSAYACDEHKPEACTCPCKDKKKQKNQEAGFADRFEAGFALSNAPLPRGSCWQTQVKTT